MTEEELANINSQFLINSWSFSKVGEFSRNEKAFEMTSIYGYEIKNSSTNVAGVAYHNALQHFFQSFKEGNVLELVDLEVVAYDTIDETPANKWKIQKTTPTIADAKLKATKTVSALLQNFMKEIGTYLDEIDEILDVEIFGSEFVIIDGVEIPLPCNFKIDLVFKSKEGKIVITDHKSKMAISSEEEMKLLMGKQGITYVKGYESKSGIKVDEVWFIENKYSENRDRTNQLVCFKINFESEDVRRLYEALLYEPLKKMIEAVNDPDYIYMINDSDNLVDRAEIYEFWCKTRIAEVEDFNIDPAKKELIALRLKKTRDVSLGTINPKVIKQFQESASQFIQYDLSNKNMSDEEKIEHVLRTFGAPVKVEHKFNGYSSNTFLLAVSGGVKISSIQNHKLDLASALNVSNVRISKDLVVHEGKAYLSVDLSKKRERDLLLNKKDLVGYKIPIGRDNFENVIYWDLENHSTPHALVCGATGSGKSVSLRSTIEYMKLAKISDITILDPKYEFSQLKIPGVKVISDILEIEDFMIAAVDQMNLRVQTGGKHPFKAIIFDEFADAQAQARSGKELNNYEDQEVGFYRLSSAAVLAGAQPQPKIERVLVGQSKSLEENLRILAQKGRSVGYRIMAATQRASVKIITGDAKANFPVQICYRVPKEVDSKVVLDEGGAESLGGYGDGLIRSPEYPELVRFQAYYKP
ncbi:DNA translocase FtsK [Flavobacterium sp. FlaQc-50]|uniref:DNA translocase FtsK n=1 Tax=unclassified Flavobacterium TaxID=196869 RepID=UPI003757F82A